MVKKQGIKTCALPSSLNLFIEFSLYKKVNTKMICLILLWCEYFFIVLQISQTPTNVLTSRLSCARAFISCPLNCRNVISVLHDRRLWKVVLCLPYPTSTWTLALESKRWNYNYDLSSSYVGLPLLLRYMFVVHHQPRHIHIGHTSFNGLVAGCYIRYYNHK